MMGVRGIPANLAGRFALCVLFCLVAFAPPAVADSDECGAEIARQPLRVSKGGREALHQAKRSGILEAWLVLQIPTADARGVLPPYVRLIVERDRVKAALEAAGATVQIIETGERTVARLTLSVMGPFEAVFPVILANRWVSRLVTDGETPSAPPLPESPSLPEVSNDAP